MLNIAVLVSGSGTNLQAIIDATNSRELTAKIKVVLTDKGGAFAIERAKQAKLPVEVITKLDYPHREEFDKKAIEILNGYGVDLIVLAGFMRLFSPLFIGAFSGRIINIHPSLLPAFPGLNVQKKALEYGVKFSGCTVHFVDEGLDSGPIIIQAVVPVLDGDTVQELKERILKEEHAIYPRAIEMISKGRVELKGRRVILKDA